MNARDLPVYQQRERILTALKNHRVVVVESPTGSGKTTQLPVILHEAGYSRSGVIGVTQPRRIAAVSVSAFVARQLSSPMPGLVGYKMRFDDQTTLETRIKIMTDGILLQEIKADQDLSDYSVIMVDEAHERSLNIDFVLGLLKRAMELRDDLRVIVSSATINAAVFSEYFDSCPVVRIETPMYPVQIIYDDPHGGESASHQAHEVDPRGSRGRGNDDRRARREASYEALLDRIVAIVKRVLEEEYPGDMLIFLSGEQMIKDCVIRLYSLPVRRKLHILPLYGRLSKEEQDEVFPPAPEGRTKIVVATNIAETSITIDGITVVIDSGLSKTNFYNPRTYTSALVEGPISRASANQRRGRAGRTQPGRCYRLYSRRDFESRPLFQEDEIYRTDLSEVVLRMAELDIRDFENFDFISSPGKGNILGAIETLRLLDALDDERRLTAIGTMMAVFPLLPRHSRIIVEAIHRYPAVLDEILTAVAFLTSRTPFVLVPGEEAEARRAHHRYRDELGDFVSYLRLFEAYCATGKPREFCESRYLDPRVMAEIANVKQQLAEIVATLGIPVGTGGSRADYLSAIARGLIQFVCVHTGKGVYQSLTAERIQIHPGSGLFRETPQFIVAGEIVKTSRTYARSVSPLHREWLRAVSEDLYRELRRHRDGPADGKKHKPGRPGSTTSGAAGTMKTDERRDSTWQIQIGRSAFTLLPYKGKKKIALIPYEELVRLCREGVPSVSGNAGNIRTRVELGEFSLLAGMRLATVLRVGPYLQSNPPIVRDWQEKTRVPVRGTGETGHPGPDGEGTGVTGSPTAGEDRRDADTDTDFPALQRILRMVLQPAPLKRSASQLGFLALYCSRDGEYRVKPNRSFLNAAHESLASLEQLVDDLAEEAPGQTLELVNATYRRLAEIVDTV
jgi:ATP-dependent helicase HrpA